MSYIKNFLQVLIGFVGLAIFEDYNRCMTIVVGFIIILAVILLEIISPLFSIRKRIDTRQLMKIGAFTLICGFCFVLGARLHIKKTDSGFEIVSPFFSHVLACGNHIDTLKLVSSYEVYYDQYAPCKEEDFYLLYHPDSCMLFNKKHGKIITVNVHQIIKRDFGHGEIHLLKIKEGDNWRVYDLFGNDVLKEGYRPYTKDLTPPDFNL